MEHVSMGIMRTKYAQLLCGIAIALAGVVLMRAQDLRDANFSGVISDYTPSLWQAVRMSSVGRGRWTSMAPLISRRT
jgi:hypothetical protein